MRENSLKKNTEKNTVENPGRRQIALQTLTVGLDGFTISVPEDCGVVIYCICRYPRQRFFDVT